MSLDLSYDTPLYRCATCLQGWPLAFLHPKYLFVYVYLLTQREILSFCEWLLMCIWYLLKVLLYLPAYITRMSYVKCFEHLGLNRLPYTLCACTYAHVGVVFVKCFSLSLFNVFCMSLLLNVPMLPNLTNEYWTKPMSYLCGKKSLFNSLLL